MTAGCAWDRENASSLQFSVPNKVPTRQCLTHTHTHNKMMTGICLVADTTVFFLYGYPCVTPATYQTDLCLTNRRNRYLQAPVTLFIEQTHNNPAEDS